MLEIAVLACSSCGSGYGQGKAKLTGNIASERCTVRGPRPVDAVTTLVPFTLDAAWVTIRHIGVPSPYDPSAGPAAGIEIQIQRDAQLYDRVDSLYLEIDSSRQFPLGTAVPVAGGVVEMPPGPNIRAAFSLFETCVQNPLAFEVQGSITFSAFDPAPGGHIAATYSIDLLGARDGLPAGHLDGNVDLVPIYGENQPKDTQSP